MNTRNMISSLIICSLLTLTPIATVDACKNDILCVFESDNPFVVSGGTTLLVGIGLLTSIPAASNATSETFNYYFKKSAQNDAAAFIASNGEIRGAFFESALKTFNAQRPGSNVKDMDVALWLVSANPLL